MRKSYFTVVLLLLAVNLFGIDMKSKGAGVILSEHTADSLLNQADDAFKANNFDEARQLYEKALPFILVNKRTSKQISKDAHVNLIACVSCNRIHISLATR